MQEAEKIQERITRLASGIAVIRVGAASDVEMVEKKHRIEDALEAVNAAQLEGIVPGGGVALIRAAKKLKIDTKSSDQKLGAKIICEAIKEPLKQMALNAGYSPDILISLVEKAKGDKGIDFNTGKLTNLLEKGIIDPAKVTRCAIQNAVSVASILITTNYAIIESLD